MKKELHHMLHTYAKDAYAMAKQTMAEQEGGNRAGCPSETETRAAYLVGLAVGAARAALRTAEAAEDYPMAIAAGDLSFVICEWWMLRP